MSDPLPQVPPAWVHKRDGRLVPFEADKISRALFAATEGLGRPDAFLARELADGVVHFLTAEGDSTPPTTAQIAELVFKVVRELGQPAVAEAFAEHARRRVSTPAAVAEAPAVNDVVLRFRPGTPLAAVLADCTRAYALNAVFTRDLLAAQDAGLLTLTGLEAPDALSGCVLGPPRPGVDLATALEEIRGLAGGFVVLDAPERFPELSKPRALARAVTLLAQDFLLGLRLTGLHAVVNLNSAAPPSWADDLAEGPLFASQRQAPPPDALVTLAERLAEELREPEALAGRVRLDWHLSERDFAPAATERLHRLTRWALEGAAVGFVFDRPRRPVHLAEGVDRQNPAALLTVGVHLPRLAEQPGIDGDPERFLHKLGSLTRLALSAAVQKREYLRRQDRARPAPRADAPAITSGFLLDRARLVVAPVGLEAVVDQLTQRGLGGGGAALELGRRIVQRLREVLHQDGQAVRLKACVDGPFDFHLGGGTRAQDRWTAAENAAGVSPWDAATPLKAHLRAGGVLHAAAEGGTLALFVPDDHPPTPEQAGDWLRAAWGQSEIVRVRFVRGAPAPRQLTFGG